MIHHLLAQNAAGMHIVSGFEMKQKAKKFEDLGEKVIHLEIGEPDFHTPDNITQAAIRALEEGHSHYAPALGIPALRETIARYVGEWKGIQAGPGNVVVTPGAKPILYYTFMAFVCPGDEVIIPDPGFSIYGVLTRYREAVPVPLKAKEENNFRITLEDLIPLVNDKTKLLILNSPNNPTGSIIEEEEIRRIAEPAVRCSNSSRLHANSATSSALSSRLRGAKSSMPVGCANLFHGQASWQSSQP